MRPMADQVSVTTEIAAPAEQVWAMIADVTRMGEWSPENRGGHVVAGRHGPDARRHLSGSEP